MSMWKWKEIQEMLRARQLTMHDAQFTIKNKGVK